MGGLNLLKFRSADCMAGGCRRMSTRSCETKARQQFIAGSRTGAADERPFDDLDSVMGEIIARFRAHPPF